MQTTVNTHLNARAGSPFTTSSSPYFLQGGDTLTIDDSVIGEEIEGNSIWYHGVDGNYFWSGGVQDTEFKLPGKVFSRLDGVKKLAILKSLKNEKYSFFRQKVHGLIGCGVGFRNDRRRGALCLVFYVESKKPLYQLPKFQVPKTMLYKGWEIPTDVKESGKPRTHQYNQGNQSARLDADSAQPMLCGGSIWPNQGNDYGTRTLKVLYNNQLCVLTCFHVLFESFVPNSNPVKFPGIPNLPSLNAAFPAQPFNPGASSVTGAVIKGQYDGIYDFALAAIQDFQLDNSILDAQGNETPTITGFYQENELVKQLSITCFGATSGPQSGVITDFCQDTDIQLGTATRNYRNLVVSEKIAEPGDSGAPVIGPDNRLVGYVVAGTTPGAQVNPPKTFVIPWFNLFYNQNITIPNV